VIDRSFDIREHAELREDHRSRGVAIERSDFTVHETEDVTARRVHPLARSRDNPHRRGQGALMRTLEGKFHDDDVIDVENPVKLAMHVWKCFRIDFDRFAQAGRALGSAVSNTNRHVGERPVGREVVDETFDVHLFCHFVCSPNDLLVVHKEVFSVRYFESWDG